MKHERPVQIEQPIFSFAQVLVRTPVSCRQYCRGSPVVPSLVVYNNAKFSDGDINLVAFASQVLATNSVTNCCSAYCRRALRTVVKGFSPTSNPGVFSVLGNKLETESCQVEFFSYVEELCLPKWTKNALYLNQLCPAAFKLQDSSEHDNPVV
jgi:hypothetical protein